MVYILLADGFEEAEALVPCDLLRRSGIEVQLAGVGKDTVCGSHGIKVCTDIRIEDIRPELVDMLVLPGGTQGVTGLACHVTVRELVQNTWAEGKYIAAICAAPTLLAELGITDGRSAVCYPGLEDKMGAALMRDCRTVRDGKLITAQAAGSSFAFALELITALRGAAASERIARQIVL